MANAAGLLECSKYDLVPDSNCGRKVVLVKLTGSCLAALENDTLKGKRKRIVVQWNGEEGELIVCDDSKKSFSFSVASSGAEGQSLECLRMTGRACSGSRDSRVGGTERPQLQALGLLSTRMTVKANNDVFKDTYKKVISTEEKRKDSSAIWLDTVGGGKGGKRLAKTSSTRPVPVKNPKRVGPSHVSDAAARRSGKLTDKPYNSLSAARESRQAGGSRLGLSTQKASSLKPTSDSHGPASRTLRRSPSVAKYVNKLGLPAEDNSSSVTPLTAGNQRIARQQSQTSHSTSAATADNLSGSRSFKQPFRKEALPASSTRPDRNGLDDGGGMSRIATVPVKPSAAKRPKKHEPGVSVAEEPVKKKVKEDLYAWKGQYSEVTSYAQRCRYKNIFNTDYTCYSSLKEKIDAVREEFMKLEDKWKKVQGTVEEEDVRQKVVQLHRQYQEDEEFIANRELYFALHEKLSHIKKLIEGYDSNLDAQ